MQSKLTKFSLFMSLKHRSDGSWRIRSSMK